MYSHEGLVLSSDLCVCILSLWIYFGTTSVACQERGWRSIICDLRLGCSTPSAASISVLAMPERPHTCVEHK